MVRKNLLGQPTRGKTAHNRLRRVDNFVLLAYPQLLRRRDGIFANALFVDVGYGAEPFTTCESGIRFRRLNPVLPVLGVEIDPERVKMGQPFADALTHFRLGGFNLPLEVGETVRLIRVFNVLRQYEELEVVPALTTLSHSLLPDGILIEGTSDPYGQLWTANILQKTTADKPAQMIGLLFSTNFRQGFHPQLFQPVLPKNYIHRMVAGEPIYHFFQAWKQAYTFSLPYRPLGNRRLFAESAKQLATIGYSIDLRPRLINRGYLFWRLEIPKSA